MVWISIILEMPTLAGVGLYLSWGCIFKKSLGLRAGPWGDVVWFGFNRGHSEVSTGSSVEAMSIPLTRSLL